MEGKASLLPLPRDKSCTHENKICHRLFSLAPTLARVLPPFSRHCLITLICSNRIGLSLFSGKALHSAGGVISVYFSFIFNGSSSRQWAHKLLSSCTLASRCTLLLWGLTDGEGKRLKVEVGLDFGVTL